LRAGPHLATLRPREPTLPSSRPFRNTFTAASLAVVAACHGGASTTHPAAPDDAATSAARDTRTGSDASIRSADAGAGDPRANTASTLAASTAIDDAACTVIPHVNVAAGWRLRGFQPGPTFTELFGVRRHRLVALTPRRVCTSDDTGDHWTERFAVEAPRATLTVQRVDRRGTLVAIVTTPNPQNEPSVTRLAISRDADAESWNTIALPTPATPLRAAFSDGLGRIFATTSTQLFMSSDLGAHWQGPRPLPGREATELAACGPIVIARARADIEWFYHRSFDHGLTWRPFRLGVLGLDADRSLVRCITERGGIEAGRPPLPSSWSWDGGLRWSPAPYDADAQRVARATTEAGHDAPGESPHCHAGPGRLVECVDTGRSRLVTARGVMRTEVHAPSLCEHVRQIDARRTLAFGAGCGLYGSPDRGGRWRMHSQSLAARVTGTFAEGRGGFVTDRIAWRLDGGVWWTSDGGDHWQPTFSPQGRVLDRGVFVDRRNGVFATSNGWVVSTHDGGRTFTYVLRGDVERIASTRRGVIVTTTQTVRVSPDGGRTWLATGAAVPSTPIDPSVEIVGNRRSIVLGAAGAVVQEGGDVRSGANGHEPIASGLPAGYHLLAAHATRGRIDRVLLEGGAVLARD
jgi:hypothetical protein